MAEIRRRCTICGAKMITGDRHRACWACRKPLTDYPPHVIEQRYLRAVWHRNPRLAQALAQRAS